MVELSINLKAEVENDSDCSKICNFLGKRFIEQRSVIKYWCNLFGAELSSGTVIRRCQQCIDACDVSPSPSREPDSDGFTYDRIEGWVHDLGCTVRECIDCGCLVPGGPTRCKRCANGKR